MFSREMYHKDEKKTHTYVFSEKKNGLSIFNTKKEELFCHK